MRSLQAVNKNCQWEEGPHILFSHCWETDFAMKMFICFERKICARVLRMLYLSVFILNSIFILLSAASL